MQYKKWSFHLRRNKIVRCPQFEDCFHFSMLKYLFTWNMINYPQTCSITDGSCFFSILNNQFTCSMVNKCVGYGVIEEYLTSNQCQLQLYDE